MAEFTDPEVRRLLAAIYPTRFEKALTLGCRGLWSLRAHQLGDRLDDVRCRLQWRRAERGRHYAGKEARR